MRAAKDIVKVGGFTAPHDFSYTTRANRAHEEVEQIRARIVCTPAEKEWRGRGFGKCADEIRTFCQPSPVGEGGSRRLTNEVSFLDKATFLLSYFSVKKSTKSHLRGLSSLLKNSLRVHELVARAVRGEFVRQRANGAVVSFALSAILTIPRERT